MISQRNNILNHLEENGTITPIEALNLYGCFRLAARIGELRESHEIETDNSKGYAEYRLIKPEKHIQGELL